MFLILDSIIVFFAGFWIQSHPADPFLFLLVLLLFHILFLFLFLHLLRVSGRSGSACWGDPGADSKGWRHVQPTVWVPVLLQGSQRRTGETSCQYLHLWDTGFVCYCDQTGSSDCWSRDTFRNILRNNCCVCLTELHFYDDDFPR